MLLLLLAAALSHPLPQVPRYAVQIDIIQATDTVTAKFILEEGVFGRIAIQSETAVTLVRAMVRPAGRAGCLQVDVSSSTGPDEQAVMASRVAPNATIHLCGVSIGRIVNDDGPLYQVIVEALSPASHGPLG